MIPDRKYKGKPKIQSSPQEQARGFVEEKGISSDRRYGVATWPGESDQPPRDQIVFEVAEQETFSSSQELATKPH